MKKEKKNARQIMSYIIHTRGSGGVRCSGTGDDKDENFRSRNGTMLQVQNSKTKFIRKFKNEIKGIWHATGMAGSPT